MKSFKTGFSALAAALAVSLPAYAAPADAVAHSNPEAGNIFMSVLAGILFAFGFQVLLTALSVALGIAAVGNIEEKVNEASYRDEKDTDEKESTPLLAKISGAVGVWTLVTVSISLFFASLLGVKLSLIPAGSIGVTLGLVIWAAFFSLMAWLEAKSVMSLAGGIWRTALQGFQAAFGTAKGAMETSPEAQVEKSVRRAAHVIEDEIRRNWRFDTRSFERKIDQYFRRLEPQPFNMTGLRDEIGNLINDLEIRETHEQGTYGTDRHFVVKLAGRQPMFDRQDAKNLAGVYQKAKEAADQHERPADKVMGIIDKVTPGSEEDSRRIRGKIEEYLKNTKIEQLNPEGIKRDIDRIFSDPSSAREVISNRLGQFNADTFLSVLSQRTDLKPDQARQIAGRIQDAVTSFFSRASGTAQSAPSRMREKVSNTTHEVKQRAANWMEQKIAGYFHSIDRPEFDYESIKQDFVHMFEDPKATPEILKERFSQYDRDSLVALLSTRMSREDAEKAVSKVEEARDTVLSKAEEVQLTVQQKIEEARQTALHEAENARKAAAAAAWWIFATAAVSAAAAAAGGALAL